MPLLWKGSWQVSLNRREFLRLSALLAGSAALSACGPAYGRLAGLGAARQPWPDADSDSFRRLLRLTYGPLPLERQQVAEHGLAAWIETQLSPESIDDTRLAFRLRPYDALGLQANALADWEQETVVDQLRRATLQRRQYSARQLYERMVEFWTDHFNIYVAKGDCWFLKVIDDREVVRKHALGNFHDLLLASAHSPAMLVYLDNQANEKAAPNENYSREVMELHTLGVGSGYTQQDVMELARCLTGWGVKKHFWRGQFRFEADRHAGGVKRVLGHDVRPAGEAEAEQVLSRLALHPATAVHLATQLVERFVADHPQQVVPDMVSRAANAYLQSGGEIKAMLKVILLDGIARRDFDLPKKFKRPSDFVTSALRLLQVESDGGPDIQDHLAAMGQGLFDWPTPDGPPDVEEAWATSLLPRWSFALDLAKDGLEGSQVHLPELMQSAGATDPSEMLSALSRLLLGGAPSQGLAQALAEGLTQSNADPAEDVPAVIAAGLLAAPAFQWR
jgi:uncharacterized protein (DUF1800 family)